MGMVFTKHVTDAGSGLFEGLIRGQATFVHRVQNPAVNRLQTITDIRQSTANDDAHGVFNVGFLHLVHQVGLGNHLIRKTDILRLVITIMLCQFASPP